MGNKKRANASKRVNRLSAFRVRKKGTKRTFYGNRRSTWADIGYVVSSLRHDNTINIDEYEIVEYALVEKAVHPIPDTVKAPALTRDDVQAIRRAHSEGMTAGQLSYKYKISRRSVLDIVHRITWWED